MNRKIPFMYLAALLLLVQFTFAQVTNTITDLKINNASSTQINFGYNATVNLTFKVKLQTFNGNSNNILGNLYIYTKKTATGSEIQRGFQAMAFTVTYPPFVTQTTYNSEVTLAVSLSASDFYETGGVFYAEYKNNNNQKYKSADIAITGGTSINNPGVGAEYLKITNVKYDGSDLPLYDSKIKLATNNLFTTIRIKYDLLLQPGQSCSGYFNIIAKNLNGQQIYNKRIKSIPGNSCFSDGTVRTEELTFQLSPDDFLNGGYVYLQLDNISTYRQWNSNSIEVQVHQFTTRNEIGIGKIPEVYEGETISFIGTSVGVVTGKIFDARFNIYRDVVTPVEKYIWYKHELGSDWVVMTEEDFPSAYNINVTTRFMRKAIYQGAWFNSDILTVTVLPLNGVNAICCDQYQTTGVPLNPIIGNTPSFAVKSYTWQQGGTRGWTDIAGANSKDYTPSVVFPGRGTSFFTFRRIVTSMSNEVFYSNPVKVFKGPDPNGRYSISESLNSEITIYPNPSSSTVRVDGYSDNVSIVDLAGRSILIPQEIGEGYINLDISSLPNGVYIINMELDGVVRSEKIVKN